MTMPGILGFGEFGAHVPQYKFHTTDMTFFPSPQLRCGIRKMYCGIVNSPGQRKMDSHSKTVLECTIVTSHRVCVGDNLKISVLLIIIYVFMLDKFSKR